MSLLCFYASFFWFTVSFLFIENDFAQYFPFLSFFVFFFFFLHLVFSLSRKSLMTFLLLFLFLSFIVVSVTVKVSFLCSIDFVFVFVLVNSFHLLIGIFETLLVLPNAMSDQSLVNMTVDWENWRLKWDLCSRPSRFQFRRLFCSVYVFVSFVFLFKITEQ